MLEVEDVGKMLDDAMASLSEVQQAAVDWAVVSATSSRPPQRVLLTRYGLTPQEFRRELQAGLDNMRQFLLRRGVIGA